jgi:fatty acid desaturase
MDDLHSFSWYAAKLKKLLPPEAFKPVPTRLYGGLTYLIITIAVIFLISFNDFHPLVLLIFSFILGACFAGLGFLGHEILHGTVVRKPWLRDLLGAMAFWPLNTGPTLWRKWHNLNHHVHTQHEENDPDAWPTLERISKMRMFKWIYGLPLFIRSFFAFASLTVQFSAHSLKMFFTYVKEFNRTKKRDIWLQMILPWISWLSLIFVIGFRNWLFAYLVPLLIANFIVMAYISTNHRLNPLTPVNDPLANSLTVTVPKIVDILHFNFSYHTEHHLFPGMNPKYYPRVKQHIKEMWPERYHEMPMMKALIALWQTPRVYQKQTNLIDPKNRKTYGSLGNNLNLKYISRNSDRLKKAVLKNPTRKG